MGGKARIGAAWIALSTSMLAGGCYPLEQAPLVYSSKQQIGVHVTSGTTDTPGIDIVIGYKGLDIALVPVAVAKFCEAAEHKECLDQIYRMQVIAGGRQDPLNTKETAARMDALRTSIDNNERKYDANDKEIEATDQKIVKAQRRNKLLRAIDEIGTKLKGLDRAEDGELLPEAVDLSNNLNADLSQKTKELDEYIGVAGLDISAEESRLGKLRADNTSLGASIQLDRERLASLEHQQQGARAGSRADALSVYGTFTGDADGEAKNAGLSAGKVFATGVAAQYLAERAGTAACLASVAGLAEKIQGDDARRNALIAQAGDLCEHRETSD